MNWFRTKHSSVTLCEKNLVLVVETLLINNILSH